MIGRGARIAVVDDVVEQAEMAAGVAEEAELIPSIISESEGSFDSRGQLLERVKATRCEAVICDHRLSQTGFAQFTGAEFVASLFLKGIPAVLLSTFSSVDGETSIRLHRARIPSLINRGDLDPDELMTALRRCESELAGHVSPERQLCRTLVRIEEVSAESDIPVADAIVHTWNPGCAIRFPLDLIEDSSIKAAVEARKNLPIRLFAKVNVGSEKESDLFLQAFEWAPEPDIDQLAT